ncbi:VOC family protein [Brucella sp. JSBI001]|uniref:VOC family protein n=1 Tax=Brucella sp. JSBI001 TaxID=2886044 RepID=UPI0022314A17|nr:VOC family protein [Brucella sp. JSBI001]UZD69376.1 hypothetical protein LJ361_20055 [Brucella sp. JSBI001]
MKIETVFISVNARDFSAQSQWWSTLLERKWDREPMTSCHEWDLTDSALFQVLDNAEESGAATVTLHITDLDAHIARLRREGIDVSDPVYVEGFESLRFSQFEDPEGNKVGLLEGA